MKKLVECVPNISEGNNQSIIKIIVDCNIKTGLANQIENYNNQLSTSILNSWYL